MSPSQQEADSIYVGEPVPVDALLPVPAISPDLEMPEHDGEELGDFAETIIDSVGEVKPELLDEPREEIV